MASLNRLVTIFSANTTSFVLGTKKMTAAMRMFRTNVIASGKAINSSFNRIGLGAALATGLMIKHYATFEKRMVTVGAILGKNRQEMELLTSAAKRMGRTTIFTATQAAEAQQVMAMAGLTQNEILLALGPALQLAAVGEVEIAVAAEIAAKTMRGMSLSAADLYKVNNVLAGALVSSTTNMTQLGDALKYVAPLAAATNTSIEDTVAMIGKLSTAGFQGEMAGTGLRQAMAKLAGSTPHATKVLKDLGIATVDSSKNMLPMFDIIAQMESRALSAGQIFEVFGARAGPQMLALLAVGSDGLREYSASLEEANEKGLAAQIETEKLNTIWGAWRLMISAVSGVVIDASEKIAGAIRNAQFRFTQFFENLDSRAGIINVLSSFMESFVGTLESLLFWLNENQAGVLEFVGALTGIIVWIFDFLAAHPQLMAALIALKIAGFMGITTAVLSMAKALWSLILVLFPQLSVWLVALKAKVLLLTASVSTMHLAMAGIVVGAIVGAYALIKNELRKLNDEYERGIRALEKMHGIQMKGVDLDIVKATKIKDAADQMDALGEIQQKLGRSTASATKRLNQQEEALRKLKQEKLALEVVERIGPKEAIRRALREPILKAEIKAAEEEVAAEKRNLEAIERRVKEVDDLFKQSEARVQAGIESEENRPARDLGRDDPSGAGAAGGGAAAGGGGVGGGGGGGGGGAVGDVDKAIADRIRDTRRTEEREQFGRPAARTGAELEKFLDMGPAKSELISFMDTIDLLTQAERDGLMDRRSAAIAAGSVTATNAAEMHEIIKQADEKFRQDAMQRLHQHHQDIKEAEDKQKLFSAQRKAGSIQEQMRAEAQVSTDFALPQPETTDASGAVTQEASPGGSMGSTLQFLEQITNNLNAGTISAQQYSEKLATVTTAYNTGRSVAEQAANVEITKARATSNAAGHTLGFSAQLRNLQNDFISGNINTSQYKFAIQALSEAMRESTKEARAEAAAEKKKAAAMKAKRTSASRGGGGAGGGGGKQVDASKAHPLDVLFRNLAMAQSRQQLLNPKPFGRDVAGFGVKGIRQRRQSFAQATGDVQHIQRLISNMRMSMMRGPMMPMQGRATLNDPGMVTQQQGAVTISLPNITRMNNEEIASVSDRLDEYRSRQGRQVV